ncbi:MAG: transcription termination/antitermination protein NusG [Anaerolineae bacterium]
MEEPVEAEPGAAPEEEKVPRWYVVHTYSGYENKVRQNLLHRVESMGAGDLIFEVVVPTEEVVELHQGQRRTVQRRIFPGYVLVNMILDEHSWTVVRNTPGVTGFVGSGKEPTPLLEDEVAKIMQRMEAGAPRVRVSFQPGSKVRITDGPFAEFIGTVDTIDNDRRKVRVMVNFFGRDTPIELDFLQVEEI